MKSMRKSRYLSLKGGDIEWRRRDDIMQSNNQVPDNLLDAAKVLADAIARLHLGKKEVA